MRTRVHRENWKLAPVVSKNISSQKSRVGKGKGAAEGRETYIFCQLHRWGVRRFLRLFDRIERRQWEREETVLIRDREGRVD